MHSILSLITVFFSAFTQVINDIVSLCLAVYTLYPTSLHVVVHYTSSISLHAVFMQCNKKSLPLFILHASN